MHGPAFPFAVAGLFPEELGHHIFHFRTLGEDMAMSPMGAGDVILLPQIRANPGRYGFLTHIEMRQSGNQAASIEILDLLLEQPILTMVLWKSTNC